MTIPQTYRKSPEFSVNYDYVDIATGLGYEVYYGAETRDGTTPTTTKEYILTDQIFPSSNIDIKILTNTEIEFETNKFKKKKIIDGTAIISFGKHSDYSRNDTFLCRLYHVDKNDNETLIGSTYMFGNIVNESNILGKMEISNVTIKPNEKLILKFKGYNIGSDDTYVGIDPMGRSNTRFADSSLASTKFRIALPFKLDI
jgi:hypothetical protein